MLAVYSAEALLLAFAMKLKVSAAVSNRGAGQLNSNYQTAEVLKIGNAYAEQAASFLGQCMPASGVPLKKGLRVSPIQIWLGRHALAKLEIGQDRVW